MGSDPVFILLFVFIFGAIIGSFLNVLILRLHTGRTLGGRSFCFSCQSQLRWYELIPIVSFLFQRGHCRSCYASISFQYPLVEFTSAVLAVTLVYYFGLTLSALVLFLVGCSLLAIVVYDLRHTIIPNELVYFFIFSTFCYQYFNQPQFFSWLSSLNFLAGPILFCFFAFFWLVSGGRWMGLGDAKLALGIGWVLGISLGITAVIFSFWVGAFWGLGALSLSLFRRRKSLTMKSEIPFAPFLVLGLVLVALTRFSILDFIYAGY